MANGFFSELINPQAQTPVPSPPAQPSVAPQLNPQQHAEASQQWMAVLNDPQVMAGLFQFGLNLTQPSWDQGAAPVFRALGGGVEAAGRVAAQQEAQQSEADKQALEQQRLGLERQRVGVTAEGQQKQYELGQQQIQAQSDRLNREYELKTKLAQLPPNLAELALNTWAKLRANPPLNLLNDPEGMAKWESRQLEESISAAQRAGSALTPGASAIAPSPAPTSRITIDAQGHVIPNAEVPTQ